MPRCPACIDHPGWAHDDESRRREPADACRACFGSGVDQTPRTYVVGLPVAVTIHPDGKVEIDVDLSEIGDIDEDDEAYERYGAQVMIDSLTVSTAADTIGNHHALPVLHTA